MRTIKILSITVIILTTLFISTYFLLKDEEYYEAQIVIRGFLIGSVISLVFAFANKKKSNGNQN